MSDEDSGRQKANRKWPIQWTNQNSRYKIHVGHVANAKRGNQVRASHDCFGCISDFYANRFADTVNAQIIAQIQISAPLRISAPPKAGNL